MAQRWLRSGFLISIATIAMGVALTVGLRHAFPGKAAVGQSPSNRSAAAGERKLPPNISACSTGRVASLVTGADGTASPVIPTAVLPTSSASALGGAVRIRKSQNPSETGVAVELGGQYQGHQSCNATLSGNPVVTRLAGMGAAALSLRGLPVNASGELSMGEQRYLLRSSAFRSDLAYIFYIVPDPTSGEPGTIPGSRTYTRNLFGIVAVADDGTVLYAAVLTP